VSAVPAGYGRGGPCVGIVVWRRGGEEVSASSIFVAGIVGKKVLQQLGRCLAYSVYRSVESPQDNMQSLL
jgi:hypothetical protein